MMNFQEKKTGDIFCIGLFDLFLEIKRIVSST